ncbi:hypothetical protein DL96DRAFT_1715714 [Flagelloscypha sp. PMI_526]|nr:hypothetical protein DL96DRAFT_1715714 [Flagelloscypha sp. PMI_526]
MANKPDESEEVPSSIHSAPQPAPFSSKFLGKDPAAVQRRKIYFQVLFGGMFVTTIAMFCIFSIFWAALYRTPARNLDGWIIDFDGDLIGQTVSQGVLGATGSGAVTWHYKSTSEFPNGVSDVINSVINEKIWVAITVNPLATQNLKTATSQINGSYVGASAVTVYGNEARAENGFRSIIRPNVDAILTKTSKQFRAQYVQGISTASNIPDIVQKAPNILFEPLSYTIVNLRPFDVPVATAVTFVGLIYLLILSFYIVNISNGAREAAQLDANLTLGSLITVRLVSSVLSYFIISLFYSSVSPAFGLPMEREFGRSGFLVFWMLNFFGMLACGLALESLLAIMTIRFLPFFLLLWIISNVSVCIFPIESLPIAFRYGYAFPFYNISKAVRTIVFRTHNQLGLNFGILIAWSVLSCTTYPLFQWYARRRAIKASEATKFEEKSGSDRS